MILLSGEDKTFYGKYQVSNLGRVKRIPHTRVYANGTKCFLPEKILKLNYTFSVKKYKRQIVDLRVDGVHHNLKVHFLVANAFLEPTDLNPDGTPIVGVRCVNHKDEDTTNNCVSNLVYCDKAYNNRYSAKLKKERKEREATLCTSQLN